MTLKEIREKIQSVLAGQNIDVSINFLEQAKPDLVAFDLAEFEILLIIRDLKLEFGISINSDDPLIRQQIRQDIVGFIRSRMTTLESIDESKLAVSWSRNRQLKKKTADDLQIGLTELNKLLRDFNYID